MSCTSTTPGIFLREAAQRLQEKAGEKGGVHGGKPAIRAVSPGTKRADAAAFALGEELH